MIDWMPISNNKEIFIQNGTKDIQMNDLQNFRFIHTVTIDPVHHSKVRIIQKNNLNSVSDVNEYLLPAIQDHFCHVDHVGWKRVFQPRYGTGNCRTF